MGRRLSLRARTSVPGNSNNSTAQSGFSSNFSNDGGDGGDEAGAYAPESEIEVRNREDEDAMNEVVMAVDFRSGSVGCAYYVASKSRLLDFRCSFLIENIGTNRA